MTDVLKITQKDIDRIARLKKQTGLPDKYINYNNPIAHKSYKQAQELANILKIKYNVNATPVNPKDQAKENIEAYQSGSEIIKPVYSKGTYGVDTPGNWDPYGKDWIPGTPRGVQEEVEALERINQLKIQNTKISGSFLREFLGPFQRGEHGKGRKHFELQQKKRETFGPQDKRKIA